VAATASRFVICTGHHTKVLLYVASATNSLRVAEGKTTSACKENKIDDISHMQH
jgi:hypothetical protein